MLGLLQGSDLKIPSLSSDKSPSENFFELKNYLFLLLESVDFAFSNIGIDNFNEDELTRIKENFATPLLEKIEEAKSKSSFKGEKLSFIAKHSIVIEAGCDEEAEAEDRQIRFVAPGGAVFSENELLILVDGEKKTLHDYIKEVIDNG